jgi:hypothetical protein
MLIGPVYFSGFGRLLEECITPYSLNACVAWKRETTESWFVDFITDFITYLKELYGTVNILRGHSILYAVRTIEFV